MCYDVIGCILCLVCCVEQVAGLLTELDLSSCETDDAGATTLAAALRYTLSV